MSSRSHSNSQSSTSCSPDNKMEGFNNNNQLRNKDSIPDHKDEYLDDPLPDLVGNLTITEEPEPDLTMLDQEFVLEDFEFNITSDEDDDSGSDMEFFDATSVGEGRGHRSSSAVEGQLPENENVHVELDHFSINNCDEDPTQGPSSGQVNSGMRRLENTARKVVSSVKGMVGKHKSKKHIRIVYSNLDKPYSARVSSTHQFKNFLTLGEGS